MRIFLEFVPPQGPVHRLRLTYAFRLFCAIYDHDPVLDPLYAHTADLWISYGAPDAVRVRAKALYLSSLYSPRPPRTPAPAATRARIGEEDTVLIYAPKDDGAPDWLAEIFEWVSCADEYSVSARDSVGRIPFHATYAGRNGLDIRHPYAAVAMHLLQREICKLIPRCSPHPVSPSATCEHFIINTHDVDFLPSDRVASTTRLAKNVMASLLLARSPSLAMRQAVKALKTAFGTDDALDQISALLAGESKRSASASFYFISSHRHRRDANYELNDPQVARLLHQIVENNMEVGVHGSYTSLDKPERLSREFYRLRELGFRAEGGRQHWLRFTLDRLIQAVERAGAVYDASLGWGDRVGFRAGACFAFPPYDFAYDRAANFIEIPLVIMDQALQGKNEENPYEMAADVLSASRRYGWGGISVLWHPTAFGGSQLSEEVGRVFWKLLDDRKQWTESWTSGASFVSTINERYSRVGLITSETRPRDTIEASSVPAQQS